MQILLSMKILRKILWLGILVFATATVAAVIYYFSVTHAVNLSPEKLLLNEKNVVVYDADGQPIQSVTSKHTRGWTPINDIPPHLKSAFIDTEDKRFYKHNGYDFKRILRAASNNVKAHSFKEGASTISQQLIKNTHLSQEKTFKRKLQEWKLTQQLERKYSKDEILEKYMNTIYFGHSCFGVTSASNFYFGKRPAELTIDEAAILAGLVKSPNNYSPFKNLQACQKRKCIVLNAMFRNSSISEKEKNQAVNAPLPPAPCVKQDEGYLHFVFDELSSLSEKYDFKVGGKVEIYTYLDTSLQESLEKIAQEYTTSDKTFLVLDKDSRGFKGCVSTVGNIPRLPGSLIKPLLVYAPALEENLISPATPILDEKINFSGYSPENYDASFHGYVSARECVEKSLNVPAVKILDTLTVDKGVEYLAKLGLPVTNDDKSLALALGGMKNGYTLKDIAGAYSALQNNGVFDDFGFISSLKINGMSVYKKASLKRQVFSPDTTCLMTDILKSTAQNGTAKKLRTLPFEIAAKTGTVGTNQGNTDAYALSYTTRDCVAVWLGNADNSKIKYTGGGIPCQLLQQINQTIYEQYSNAKITIPNFPIDKNVSKIELDKQAYYDTHTLSLADANAPIEYRFCELFKNSAIPLNQSTSFSYPTIYPPKITVENNVVVITFDERSPSYYTYKIDRYDYATHTTLYEGKLPSTFQDDDLMEGKNYVYTVTPIYKNNIGVSIALPTITTKQDNKAKINQQEILSKEWWDF